MQPCQQPRQGALPVVNPGVGVARLMRAGNQRGQQRLSAQMQPRYIGRKLCHRTMVLCQIIDDDAPMRWTRYRFAAKCIASNGELMNVLKTLRDERK